MAGGIWISHIQIFRSGLLHWLGAFKHSLPSWLEALIFKSDVTVLADSLQWLLVVTARVTMFARLARGDFVSQDIPQHPEGASVLAPSDWLELYLVKETWGFSLLLWLLTYDSLHKWQTAQKLGCFTLWGLNASSHILLQRMMQLFEFRTVPGPIFNF